VIVAMKNAVANQEPVDLGADVASTHLDICVHGKTEVKRVANEDKAIKQWLRQIPPGSRLAMESTGRYHQLLARLAHDRGLQVYVLNPRDVNHYARGVGQRGKTDRLDAQVIARYVANEHAELRRWQPAPAQLAELDSLLRKRAALTRSQGALRQSLGDDTSSSKLLPAPMASFDETMNAIDKAIETAAKSIKGAEQTLRSVMSVPGIGPLNGAALLSMFTRLRAASADAVVAFTGLDPRPMDSGNKRGVRRLSKRGPAELRRLLFNAARSASRTPAWRGVYERELSKGLSSTAATVVLARKLVRVAFSLFKSQTTFDLNYGQEPRIA
jgi:transposase